MELDEIRIVPAGEAPWVDIRKVFGTADYPSRCFCQRYRIRDMQWSSVTADERAERLRTQVDSGNAGLVAYLGEEPVGWCAVEPRTEYQRLLRMRTPWTNRKEDKADDGVWAVTCFVTRVGYRKRGITYALAAATVDYARSSGAKAVEGYPMLTEPGREITWGELHVGSRNVFADAGFTEVSHPSPRRFVMRINF